MRGPRRRGRFGRLPRSPRASACTRLAGGYCCLPPSCPLSAWQRASPRPAALLACLAALHLLPLAPRRSLPRHLRTRNVSVRARVVPGWQGFISRTVLQGVGAAAGAASAGTDARTHACWLLMSYFRRLPRVRERHLRRDEGAGDRSAWLLFFRRRRCVVGGRVDGARAFAAMLRAPKNWECQCRSQSHAATCRQQEREQVPPEPAESFLPPCPKLPGALRTARNSQRVGEAVVCIST